MRLKGKIAVITGGSSGIGLEVAKNYALEGAKVYLCGSREESAQKAFDKIKDEVPKNMVIPVKMNVCDMGDIDNLFQLVKNNDGYLDILVNNAGIVLTKSVLEMTDEEYDKVLNTNSKSIMQMIRKFAPLMMEKGGSIINTSSMVGTYGAMHQVAYSASKFAINGITKSCAKELGKYNIRVNAVAPGVVETPMMEGSVNDEVKQRLILLTPLKRTATPKDLYGIYVFLASNEASFITSAIIPVDGGILM